MAQDIAQLRESTTEPTEQEAPGDWDEDAVASLRPPPSLQALAQPTWRVHDRTHLEFAIDYRLDGPKVAKAQHFEWEAYFFVPESLRLDSDTYKKDDIYSDLKSHVRLALEEIGFRDLAGAALERLRQALAAPDEEHAARELRLYACHVRAAAIREQRRVLAELARPAREAALERAGRMIDAAREVAGRMREVLWGERSGHARRSSIARSDTLATTCEWVDEDVSLVLESLLGKLAQALGDAGAPPSLRQRAVDTAVDEARHRARAGLDSFVGGEQNDDAIEHLVFRRHTLKRFTSSALWLSYEVHDPGRWAMHLLYALAASLAMAFAVIATLWNGADFTGERLWMWLVVAVVAYAIKDRMKAALQEVFSGVVSRHFPDRRWRIRDRERSLVFGHVDEQSGFVGFERLPEGVLHARRRTRRHPMEELARPEKVLWHRKTVEIRADRVRKADPRFGALREIFRLDVDRWLAHTDDPKERVVFADPCDAALHEADAPRVYNLAVVYRLRREGDADAPWHRVRVVVTRKGIRRIDPVC